jgi:ribosomal silencing factor RsfS
MARAVRSRVFTMDVAQRCGGEWIIVDQYDLLCHVTFAITPRRFYGIYGFYGFYGFYANTSALVTTRRSQITTSSLGY